MIGLFRLAPASVRPAPRHRRTAPAATAPVPVRPEVGSQGGTVSITAPASIGPRPYVTAVRPATAPAPATPVAAVLRQPTGPIRNLAELDAVLSRTDRPDPPIYRALVAAFGFNPAPQPIAVDVPVVPGPWFGGAR
jgi:hypothetical protein